VYPEKATEQANGEEVRNNFIHIINMEDKLLRRKFPCSDVRNGIKYLR
jgi:hypothetical protein